MYKAATVESLLFSGCVFFVLLMLCSLSYAGGAGRAGGDYSAPVRIENAPGPVQAPKKEPPEKEPVIQPPTEQPSAPVKPPEAKYTPSPTELFADVKDMDWMERPGNNLKLGAYILTPISIASLIAGGIFVAGGNKDCSKYSGWGGFGCGISNGISSGTGIGFLTAGILSGAAALGLYLGGDARAKKYEADRKKALSLPPRTVEKPPPGCFDHLKWIDRPGNDLKLASYIVAGVSLGAFVFGGVMYAESNKPVGITGIVVGSAAGVTAVGLHIGGTKKEMDAENELKLKKNVDLSLFVNPITRKTESISSNASLDGAVVGVMGRF